MSASEHRRGIGRGLRRLGFAFVTVSDTRSEQSDESGRRARQLAAAAGHREVLYLLVPDEVAGIRRALEAALEKSTVDVVVFSGGTGFSPRDLTIEAVTPLFERTMEGFGELFRTLSYAQVGAAAMLSRAAAGIARGRAVFVVPGAPDAVALAMEKLILPEAAHLLAQARRSS